MDATTFSKTNINNQSAECPLLQDWVENHSNQENQIDISPNGNAPMSSSNDGEPPQVNNEPSSDIQSSTSETTPLLSAPESMISADGYSYQYRNPFITENWISVEFSVTVSQIIASVAILSMPGKDSLLDPFLFAWVISYTVGCVAALVVLYWRYRKLNQQHDLVQSLQRSRTIASEEENVPSTGSAIWNHLAGFLRPRVKVIIDHFKMFLDSFFAIWFIITARLTFGNYATSPGNVPSIYKLCIVFLIFSCVGHAMPFIVYTTVLCCMPWLSSVLSGEHVSHALQIIAEAINSLPIYNFEVKNNENVDDHQTDAEVDEGGGHDGVLAAGTDRERAIPGEDAVCCICLNKYENNAQLTMLPCSHVFHVNCVDQWLWINPLCPLCKGDIRGRSSNRPPG